MLGLSDLTEGVYSRGILWSIPKYLPSWKRRLSHGDKNSGEDGFPYIDWTATVAGRDAVMAARRERFDLRPNDR